jgi:hypothetical protein
MSKAHNKGKAGTGGEKREETNKGSKGIAMDKTQWYGGIEEEHRYNTSDDYVTRRERGVGKRNKTYTVETTDQQSTISPLSGRTNSSSGRSDT